MKMAWKLLRRVLAGLLLTVYVVVALVNYSVVQSYLGTAAGLYFSREWGGTVKIGALHAMPWDHLIINNILLVSPDNDTIFRGERLSVRFKQFPYTKDHLTLESVYLRNAYYHLEVSKVPGEEKPRINLQHIIDYYYHPDTTLYDSKFTVDVGTLTLDHVHYKMDLPETYPTRYDVGVVIPHMEYFNIVSRVRDIHLVNDDVSCRLIKMSAEERSGFKVTQVEGNVHVGPENITVTDFEVRTEKTTIRTDVTMNYHNWMGLEYCDSVQHDVVLKEGTSVAMSDAAYWAPVLWGIETQVEATGIMKGTINNMYTEMAVHWGDRSGVLVAGNLVDITYPDSATLNVDIERMWTNPDDLAPLLTLLNVDLHQLPLATQVGYLDLGGRLHGGLHQMTTANISLLSGLGNLHADALITPDKAGGMRFNAEIGSNGLGLNLLHSDWLSHTGFALSASGSAGNLADWNSYRATLEGQLLNSVVRGQRLSAVDLSCTLDGGRGSLNIESADSLAMLVLQGNFDLKDTVKQVRCTLDVERLNTYALKLLPEKFGMLKTAAELRYEGCDLETMRGTVALHGTRLGELAVDRLTVNAYAADNYKEVQLQSDPVDLTVDGRFDYHDLPLMARQVANDLLPADFFTADSLTLEERQELEQSNVQLNLVWKDNGRFLGAVTDGLALANNTRLTASYNHAEGLKAVLRSDGMRFGTATLNDVGLDGRRTGDSYAVRLLTQEVNIGAVELLQGVDLRLTNHRKDNEAAGGSTVLGLTWGYDETPSQGDVELRLQDGRIEVLKPNFSIGGTPWELESGTLHVGRNNGRLTVAGEGISVHSDLQSVDARLNLTGQKGDVVELMFDQFSLAGLSDIFLQDSPLGISGDLGGRFSLYGMGETPYFNANLRVTNCMVNRQPLGEVGLRSNWNAELNNLNLQLEGEQIQADGWLALGKEEPEMYFGVDFEGFELGLAAPLLSAFSSRFEGRLHGSFDIAGTLKKPVIVGEALVEEGALQVDMTGVTYFFDDSLQFTNKRIDLDNFHLRDHRGNAAFVDGTIAYDGFDDVEFDLGIQTDNLLVLDRHKGDEFYGTVLASAVGTVRGPVDALSVNVSARTMPGCKLTIPVNDQRQVKAQDYIHFHTGGQADNRTFRQSDNLYVDQSDSRTEGQSDSRKKMTLEVDLAITPEVQLDIPMDFSELGATVSANGTGDLHLSMEGADDPLILGNYEFTSGTMKFSALSIISKEFAIESGSNLNFQGSLPDARFDLRATYSQRVNLSTLTGGMTDMGGTQKVIQVQNLITVAGTLQEPTLGFDILLPNADASVEEEVFAFIDRNSERDMLNQTLSLLAMGHFYNANSTSANGNLATSGSISALNSLLSGMTGIDIGVDYKMGNELTKDQVDVNFSKDWGRWYLESTLGYGGESRELPSSDVSNAVIDALVGYRISPLVHLFAYNRTNTNDYTRMDLPYKQGVGLKLTKDFDSWGDLFRVQKNKKERKQ